MTACQVLVNGVEMGRQGGFDPYADHRKPRVRRYDLAGVLRPGANEVTVRVGDGAEPVLVDGCVTSGPGWWAVHDGERVAAEIHRTQYRDPAALHLPRRPHPLPDTSWLSGEQMVVSRSCCRLCWPSRARRGASNGCASRSRRARPPSGCPCAARPSC